MASCLWLIARVRLSVCLSVRWSLVVAADVYFFSASGAVLDMALCDVMWSVRLMSLTAAGRAVRAVRSLAVSVCVLVDAAALMRAACMRQVLSQNTHASYTNIRSTNSSSSCQFGKQWQGLHWRIQVLVVGGDPYSLSPHSLPLSLPCPSPLSCR